MGIETLILLLLAMAGAGGAGYDRLDWVDPPPDQGTEQQASEQADNQAKPEEPAEAKPAETATTEPAATPETEVVAPAVDVMRFDGSQGVVSGTAAPGSEVVVRDGETEVARGTADSAGNYAMTFDYDTPAEGSVLQLSSIDKDGNVVNANEALTVLPQAGGETATATLTADGVEVERPASTDLALGQLSYGTTKDLKLSGTAEPGAAVDITLNTNKLGSSQADASGNWSYDAGTVEPGQYELGLTQNGGAPVTQTINLDDQQTQTASTDGGAANGQTLSEGQTITVDGKEYVVKRGDSLWRIAQFFYGEDQGIRYTEIFDTNSSKIKNPDLIYPQQELQIPAKQ